MGYKYEVWKEIYLIPYNTNQFHSYYWFSSLEMNEWKSVTGIINICYCYDLYRNVYKA